MLKRVLDLLFSFLLLSFLWLPMVGIALLIRADSSGGAIFRQVRIGRGGRPFVCYKFRTMVSDAPKNCPTSEMGDASSFVTPFGRLLRRTSLDELPQLLNVLKGDMSLVGPRPLIPVEEEVHTLRMRTGVYALRPGMTGLSQISGRDFLDDREKVRLDARYLRRLGLREDARIVIKTIRSVLYREGVRS